MNIISVVFDWIGRNFSFGDIFTIITLISIWFVGHKIRRAVEVERVNRYYVNNNYRIKEALQEIRSKLTSDCLSTANENNTIHNLMGGITIAFGKLDELICGFIETLNKGVKI